LNRLKKEYVNFFFNLFSQLRMESGLKWFG
jgi:hypothetical protein